MNPQFFWLDYSKKDTWRDWLSRLPREKRDIYYDPGYASLYVGDGGSACCYIYAEGGNIYLYPFVMREVPQACGYFDICTPYGYGGPIFNTEDSHFLNEAYKCFCEEALRRNIISEVIKFHPLLRNHLPLIDIFKGKLIKMCSTVCVDLDLDEEHRWKNIYPSASRNKINKAKRNNIDTKTGWDDETWKAFKALYKATMDLNKAKEFYFFSSEYFKNIQHHLADNYILVSCSVNGKIISVMLMLLGTVYAHCHLVGTDREFMSTGVNNLLHHEAILWCKRNGYRKFHLGGGRGNSDGDSLLRFKKNFSDSMLPLYVGEYVLNLEVYNEACVKWSLKNPDRQVTVRLLKYRF